MPGADPTDDGTRHSDQDIAARPQRLTKGSRTKERIAQSATELFARSGFLVVSLRDIAEHAGLTHAGILHHFPGGKDELLIHVLERRDALDAEVLFDPGTRGADYLAEVVRIVKRNLSTPGLVGLYAKIANEASDPSHPAHHYFTRRYEVLREQLTHVFTELLPEQSRRSGIAPSGVAQQFLALVDGLQTQWLLAPDTVIMPDRVTDFLATLGIEIPDV